MYKEIFQVSSCVFALFNIVSVKFNLMIGDYFWIVAFINQDWFISRLFGNTLWLFAVGYYIYITFLGYSCKSHSLPTNSL